MRSTFPADYMERLCLEHYLVFLYSLRWLNAVSLIVKKNANFKECMNIFEWNETFRISNTNNTNNRYSVLFNSDVFMTIMTFQNGRKLTFNQNYFENKSGDPRLIKVISIKETVWNHLN